MENIKTIVFDADDTLWDCQTGFDDVEKDYSRLLSEYGDRKDIAAALFATEAANMPLLGYGCKAFVISLIENAVRLSGGKIDGGTVGEIVAMGKRLLTMPATPLEGVRETLEALHGRFPLVLFTKGELLDQHGKLDRSGLKGYFSHVEVVNDKTVESYRELSRSVGNDPGEMLMVGNSFKSDIAPAVKAGYHTAHIPYHATWQLEHTEEFSHERIHRLGNIREVAGLVERLTQQ